MSNGAKKSFYIFLSSLLGMMLFILLERSLFLLAFLLGVDVLSGSFAQLDYIAFIAACALGLWYGIWVGLYWYTIVYEEGSHPGMFRGVFNSFSGKPNAKNFENEGRTWELEDLMNAKPSGILSGPTLEVFESNTVAFTASTPVHADNLHESPAATAIKPKRVIKRTVKKTVK